MGPNEIALRSGRGLMGQRASFYILRYENAINYEDRPGCISGVTQFDVEMVIIAPTAKITSLKTHGRISRHLLKTTGH